MTKGRDRNQPCWCGSGQKFKHCHLARESQDALSIWDARKEVQKGFATKTCLHPLAGPAACAGPIVRAHTVRRAADLSVIARKGHVYQTSADLGDLQKNGGRLVPKLVGIKEASTFLGFCGYHDASTFAPLERTDLVPTDEQAFLLAYRPLCRELYVKERHLESFATLRQADRGRPLADQLRIQEFVLLAQIGVEVGLQDLRHQKAQYDRDLLAADFSQVRYVAIHLDRTPDVMCSGVVQPRYTFDGRLVQDLGDLVTPLQAMSVSLAATPAGGAAVFAWRSDSDAASDAVVDSLLRLSASEVPAAVVRYVTSDIENAYFRPEWWEALPAAEKRALLDRLEHNVGPDSDVHATYLADDGHAVVDWAVTNIAQKRR